MSFLPANHYQHLYRLAVLRRCSIQQAVEYLDRHVDASSTDWLADRYGKNEGEKKIDLGRHAVGRIMEKIQGLPRTIRPQTDGPYLQQFSFFSGPPGLLGIEAGGIKMLDFEMATERDKGVFSLVKDLLPEMSEQQYRLYNTFCSQFLYLFRNPWLSTMPRTHAVAIDAGCYVGYKVMALAQFTGGAPVLAFELESENFEVLKLNALNNPRFDIRAHRAALSNVRESTPFFTRNPHTMAHSLTPFSKLKEVNARLGPADNADSAAEWIDTTLLDDYTSEFARISALHISVNGHEPEVLGGGLGSARKADILRISCPYSRDGRAIRDLVLDLCATNNIQVFGTSGAALIAGSRLGDYHVRAKSPLESPEARRETEDKSGNQNEQITIAVESLPRGRPSLMGGFLRKIKSIFS